MLEARKVGWPGFERASARVRLVVLLSLGGSWWMADGHPAVQAAFTVCAFAGVTRAARQRVRTGVGGGRPVSLVRSRFRLVEEGIDARLANALVWRG